MKWVSNVILLLSAALLLPLAACGGKTVSSPAASGGGYRQDSAALTFDGTKWNYDETNDVYWQIGVSYCAAPQDERYETLGIYVPGAYMAGTRNADGTYTCTVKAGGTVGNYNASTAPVVIPVNTPGYAACAAPTEYGYDSVSAYLKAGFVYLQPGIRGCITDMDAIEGGQAASASPSASAPGEASASPAAPASALPATDTAAVESPPSSAETEASASPNASASASPSPSAAVTAAASPSANASSGASGGAPWGVTDLKAAIRYFRFNAAFLPGSADSVFTFGMSGGGAQSALVGASGDSALYTPYLEAIGAAMTDKEGKTISDAICGSMCWCPITSLDYADEAYEWNMGQFSSTGARANSSFGSALSTDLAAAYADYINALKLKNGEITLSLEKTDNGVYQAGNYYDYLLSVIQVSLNNFLADTTFPYTEAAGAQQLPDGTNGSFGGNASGPSEGMAGTAPSGAPGGQTLQSPATQTDGASAGTTYKTVQDYIDALNSDARWVIYDETTNKARVTSIRAFVTHYKTATKALGAFDELDRGQGENALFGNGRDLAYHFDPTLAKLLKSNTASYGAFRDWQASYAVDFAADLAERDALGTDMQTRVDMYNPMYYLCNYYKGYNTSTPAKYWRIRTGIGQSDTALTVETNLALALKNDATVKDVDFAAIWGQKHTMVERTGDSTTNFTNWVETCASGK